MGVAAAPRAGASKPATLLLHLKCRLVSAQNFLRDAPSNYSIVSVICVLAGIKRKLAGIMPKCQNTIVAIVALLGFACARYSHYFVLHTGIAL